MSFNAIREIKILVEILEFPILLERCMLSGLEIRVHTGKLYVLFLNQNICCGYSKELVLLST